MKGVKYIIYSDSHIGSPYAIRKKFIFTKNTVFLGDNFDLKNTHRERIDEVEKERAETIKKCKKVGGVYISGNHSLKPIKSDHKVARNGILFTHGDIVAWGPEKAAKWRKKSKGLHPIGYHLLRMYKKIYDGDLLLLRRKYLDRAHELALKNNCNTIVIGHLHPTELMDIQYNSVRIVIVPKGKTVITL